MIGSLDHWLSCMLDCIHIYVFLISKKCFEKLSRHLLDTMLSVELLKPFLNAILTPPRYLVDRSRKLLPPRQLLDTQWIDRASVLGSDSLLLDTSAVDDHFLDTYIDTSRNIICRALLKSLYILPRVIHFLFLRSVRACSSLKHSHFTSIMFLKVSSSFFKFSTLGKLLIPLYSCISCFKT